jgi:hypothetical protein
MLSSFDNLSLHLVDDRGSISHRDRDFILVPAPRLALWGAPKQGVSGRGVKQTTHLRYDCTELYCLSHRAPCSEFVVRNQGRGQIQLVLLPNMRSLRGWASGYSLTLLQIHRSWMLMSCLVVLPIVRFRCHEPGLHRDSRI